MSWIVRFPGLVSNTVFFFFTCFWFLRYNLQIVEVPLSSAQFWVLTRERSCKHHPKPHSAPLFLLAHSKNWFLSAPKITISRSSYRWSHMFLIKYTIFLRLASFIQGNDFEILPYCSLDYLLIYIYYGVIFHCMAIPNFASLSTRSRAFELFPLWVDYE